MERPPTITYSYWFLYLVARFRQDNLYSSGSSKGVTENKRNRVVGTPITKPRVETKYSRKSKIEFTEKSLFGRDW